MAAERASEASPHLWLSDFLADPSVQVRNLLLGRASIGALSGAQIPDAARLLFGALSNEAPERNALDRAIASFLVEERLRPDTATRSLALAYADALRVVSSLRLKACIEALRSDMDLWLSWVEALPVASTLDVRAELFSTWALTQRFVEAGAPLELEPFWLTMCEGVGDSYPRSYLQIALLGLRMLPERTDVPSERAWLNGLLRWAVARSPSADEFSFEWRALRAIYPRTAAYWRTSVAHTLKDKVAENLSSEIEDRWRYDVGLNAETEQSVSPDQLWNSMGPVQEATALIQRLDGPLTSLVPEIRQHISNRERYAEATGNYYFLTRSACNIGMRLIERGPSDEAAARGRLATELAVKALHWDAANVYGWSLWRSALAASGAREAAELVGWEAVRRFPENEQWRNQLAMFLSELGRDTEGEALLLETIRRFPRDAVSRSQLAIMWVTNGRAAEAAKILEPAIQDGFADGGLYSALTRVMYELHGVEAALRVASQGLLRFSTHEPLARYVEHLTGNGHLPAITPTTLHLSSPTTASLPPATARAGRLRRIEEKVRQQLTSGDWRYQALQEVQSELNANPHSDYGKYLLSQLQPDAPPSGFVGALWSAMERKDATLLAQLEARFAGRQHLFDVARAFLFSDKSAAGRVATWLHTEVNQESRANLALRRFMALRFGETTNQSGYSFSHEEPEHVIEVLAANDNVKWDLVEVAIASLAYPLAA